jgi:hypothetical protein
MAKKTKIPESYTLVTEANRKFSIKLGRQCFVLDENEKPAGEFTIRPRLKKGWLEFGPYKAFISENEDAKEYADSFDSIISHFIKKKQLYIDTNKPLITFKTNEKR